MLITKVQIQRFFNNDCTKEEADEIARYLEENPAVLKQYIMQEWKEADGLSPLPADTGERMFQEIRKELFAVKKASKKATMARTEERVPIKRYFPAAAAAMLILITGIVLLRQAGGHRPSISAVKKAPVKDKVAAQPAATAAQPAAAAYRLRHNDTRKEEIIGLPDGSTASLSSNSTLRYPDPFIGDKRTVYLEGKASFKVTKEHARPFTVSAGPILTTVLGTEFSVAEGKEGIAIKLYSGKVKLQAAADRSLKGWREDVILLPGEQMKYTAATALVEVSGFRKIPQQTVPRSPDNNDALVFEKRKLPDVLDILAARYRVHIRFDRNQIGGLYFTGTVLKTDSLLTILQVITNMNELEVVEDNNGYIIQKPIP